MKLRFWMVEHGHDDESFAAAVTEQMPEGESCSRRTVEKWRYGTRVPRRTMMPVISKVTNGKVLPNDFADLPDTTLPTASDRIELRKAS